MYSPVITYKAQSTSKFCAIKLLIQYFQDMRAQQTRKMNMAKKGFEDGMEGGDAANAANVVNGTNGVGVVGVVNGTAGMDIMVQ